MITLVRMTIRILFLALVASVPAWSSPEDEHRHEHAGEAKKTPLAAERQKDHDDHDETHEPGHEQGSEEPAHDHGEDEQAHGGEEHAHGDEEHGGDSVVELNAVQQSLAGIRVGTLKPARIRYSFYAPGELQADGYASTMVSPRVDSVVIRRHVVLGEHVEPGQPLVTLFSETVAEAEAQWLIADAEWRRVRKLGRKTVGEKRWVEAQANLQAVQGRLQAFGVRAEQLPQVRKGAMELGRYTLMADRAGTVLSDDFRQGQRVAAGEALLLLAVEDRLWVEARLPAMANIALPAGTPAVVRAGKIEQRARVIQQAHTIDEMTRTRVVRLALDNQGHRLHPGMFVDVLFELESAGPVMAVSEGALMRSADGDWVVFVQQPDGTFSPREEELGQVMGPWREIRGIPPGTPVVQEGAFFVASELAKSGFDPHNH